MIFCKVNIVHDIAKNFHATEQFGITLLRCLYSFLRNNLVRLRIYFEELNYQRIEQQPVWTVSSQLRKHVACVIRLYIQNVTKLETIVLNLKFGEYVCTYRKKCLQISTLLKRNHFLLIVMICLLHVHVCT